jgi:hypothetical protein
MAIHFVAIKEAPMMRPALPIRYDEVHGRQWVPSHTRTLLGSTGVEVYHEQGEPIWITYNRPAINVVWQHPEVPVLSSEFV